MKKLLLCLMLLPAVTFAQDKEKKSTKDKKKNPNDYRWEVGINGGVNFANVTGYTNASDLISNKPGNLYGLTLIYHANRFFSIKTDFDFENKGWVYEYDVDLPSNNGTGSNPDIQDVTQNLDYFDVPLFLHMGIGKRLKFDINFGTYVGILRQDNAFYLTDGGNKVTVKDAFFGGYKNLDLGLVYGVGIDYVLSPKFSLGFDSLIEQGLTVIQEANNLKNRSFDFDFGVNYLFGLKKKKKDKDKSKDKE